MFDVTGQVLDEDPTVGGSPGCFPTVDVVGYSSEEGGSGQSTGYICSCANLESPILCLVC